jgi:LPPG:FO 2-phospho-L-lactate transferase
MNDAIQGPNSSYSNPFAVLLAGGVGGARAARALGIVLDTGALTVIGNVGDDERVYGVHVSADLDTVMYTLAGIEGPHGWGIGGDSFSVMGHLNDLAVPTPFKLGDRDLATCLLRTTVLENGGTISAATEQLRSALGVDVRIIPVSNDPVRTRIKTTGGEWLAFQEYFVERGHRDEVAEIVYDGADRSSPAPGVIEAIERARIVVIAPSNPPLSIAPILAVPGIREAISSKDRVIAISPLFDGKALKGPADRVMAALGYPPGNAGILAAYDHLITDLVIDDVDAADAAELRGRVNIHVTGTLLGSPGEAERFGTWFRTAFV